MRTNRTWQWRHWWRFWSSGSPADRPTTPGEDRGTHPGASWCPGRLRIRGLLLALPLLLCLSGSGQANTHARIIEAPLRELLGQAVSEASSFRDRFDAEVWLVDMSARIARYVPDAQRRLYILRAAHREATRARLPVPLVLAVIHTESHFQRFALSSAGAQGLMQVMPFWKREIGRPDDNLTDIDTNLRYGCTILGYYLERSGGNISEALARYNGSLGRHTYPEKVFANQSRYTD